MARNREGRAVAAGPMIEVGGKRYRLRPVTVQTLCDLELEALEYCKRQCLETYTKNADLLGGRAAELIEKKLDEVSRWDLDDMPQKDAYDASRVPVNDEVKRWVEDAYGELPGSDLAIRALLSNALDTKRITSDEVREMTGKGPLRGTVRYDQWWVTASLVGMISFIAGSIRQEHPEVSREAVAKWPFMSIAEAVRKVESVTTPAVGNT